MDGACPISRLMLVGTSIILQIVAEQSHLTTLIAGLWN